MFQRLAKILAVAQNVEVLPELFADRGDSSQRFFQAASGSGHAAFVPQEQTEFPMKCGDSFPALDGQQAGNSIPHLLFDRFEFRAIRRGLLTHLRGKVITDRVWNHEVAVWD